MNNQELVNPKFFKALKYHELMMKLHGEEHPIAMQAFMLAYEYAPPWMKDEAYKMAPSGCLDSGQPVYNLQDITNYCSVTFEEAEMNILSMMQQRKELALSTDVLLINANLNSIQ